MRKAKSKYYETKVKSLIKTVFKNQTETKCIQIGGTLVCRPIKSTTTQVQLDANCLMLTPQGTNLSAIAQAYPIIEYGVGPDQRVGDKVEIQGIYINYIATANGYNATTNPTPRSFLLNVYVVRCKVGNKNGLTVSEVQSGASASFFEYQSDAESGFTGSVLDTLRKPDKNVWEVLYKKTHKMGYQGTLSTTNTLASYPNNDFKQMAKGRIKINMRGKYEFSRQGQYQGQPVYLFTQVMPVDISSTYDVNHIPCSFAINEAVYYRDI